MGCMLGSSPCATETLKNLVLPGIGEFNVVDDLLVGPADLGNNFFLEEQQLGKLRAESVCQHLCEMNPEVKGKHIAKSPVAAVAEGLDFFKGFSLVVACQLVESSALKLGSICEDLGLPLLLVTSLGLVGKMRVFKEHCVCETKPDSEFGDLRLTEPFPELQRYVDSFNIEELSDVQHGHLPYVVILIQAIDAFKKAHNNSLPSTAEEKNDFKRMVMQGQRNDKEQNYSEALDNAYKAWIPYTIPDAMQDVLALNNCNATSDFWVVARAVSQFVRDCGKLPLAGVLPDMTATSDFFVKLQEIYACRAAGDRAAITAHVASIQGELGTSSEAEVSAEYIQRFCQNAHFCEVFRFKTIQEEFSDASGPEIASECGDEDSLMPWYVVLRSADRFREIHGHWPGGLCGDDERSLSEEAAALSDVMQDIIKTYNQESLVIDSKYIEEVTRFGGCELHTISSVMGGVAAQEVVKLLTKQYAPVTNTMIYDGLNGKMQVFQLGGE